MHSPQIVDQIGPEALELVANVLPVQRPAEIVNYKSMGAMPVILAGGVAAGAVAALGLALVASVRRRRRDLALLKTLGFTRRQLAATIAWQSTVIAVGGVVVGVRLASRSAAGYGTCSPARCPLSPIRSFPPCRLPSPPWPRWC